MGPDSEPSPHPHIPHIPHNLHNLHSPHRPPPRLARRAGPSSLRGPRKAGPPPSAPPPGSVGPRSVATGNEVVERLLARRLRVCHELGIRVAPHLRSGPPETLLLRLTGVDHRLTRELEARGGVALPPWIGEPDPLDLPDGEPLPGEPDEDDEDPDEQGEPACAA